MLLPKLFQSTARWQINSYLIQLASLTGKAGLEVSIDGTLADQFLPHREVKWWVFSKILSFNRRHAGRSILTQKLQATDLNHIYCFNRRHAGRSILTKISRSILPSWPQEVSIDGTLADQFLQEEHTAWIDNENFICFNRRHAGRSILTQKIVEYHLIRYYLEVSIDGTLADQFLHEFSALVSSGLDKVSIDGTLADQFLHEFSALVSSGLDKVSIDGTLADQFLRIKKDQIPVNLYGVSIDGTLADQFLRSKVVIWTCCSAMLSFQSTARWQINSYTLK